MAAAQRDKVVAAFPGRRRLSPTKVVERGDWIIAVMPTSKMREVAAIVGDRELRLMVELALNLHEFRYNGLDGDAEVSRYASEEMVKRDIEDVVAYIKRAVSSQQS
jgi:hypothetical protein